MSFAGRKPKLLLAIAIALPILLATGWVANHQQSAKMGDHIAGKRYEGRVKQIDVRSVGRRRQDAKISTAIVRTGDGREILVHDPEQRFAGCGSGDRLGYRMEESTVRGVEFLYVPGSCRSE
jgi:hypothetical protein